MQFEVGQRIGDYEIVRAPGADGPGEAYGARNITLERDETLVVLLPDRAAQPELAGPLAAESRAIAGFNHPNIAQIYTTFVLENRLLMTRESVAGLPLDRVEQQSLPAPEESVGYLSQVLSALSYAHSRGVVHGHLRPANIMVDREGTVKVLNFGLAGAATDTETDPEHSAADAAPAVGGLSYLSPEQAQGANADVRSDLYSAGIVLYDLLAGRLPFRAGTVEELLDQERNAPLQPPSEINPAVPPILSDIVLTAIARNAAERFQNADAFRNALRHVPPSPPPPTPGVTEVPVAAAMPVTIPAAPAAEIPPVIHPPVLQAVDTQVVVPVAAPVPAPVFENVFVPADIPVPAASGHRRVWISLVALVALAILVAAGVALPHFLKPRATSAESPAAAQIAANPASSASAAPVPATTATSEPESANPAIPTQAVPASSADQAAATAAQLAANDVVANAAAKQPRPAYSPKPPAPPNPAAQPPADAAPSAPAGPTDQDVEQARSELTSLDARATIVSASVERLRSEQNADGLDLRQDMAGAYAQMNACLRAASADMESRNISAARVQMDQADKEITTLEGLFRR